MRHAAAMAALGPHPWGSPRAAAAAQYVAAQLRGAGLRQVELQAFESQGLRGANVVGVLPGPGREFVVVGAHHDTAPEAPGAYDDGGGVGVLLEAARVLARRPPPPRTIVFVSWDGEEAWSTGRTTTAGSREYVRALGPRSRDLVAAFVVEMCGWKAGRPVLHPIAYADPLRPGRYAISPGWLVAAAQRGARQAGAPFGVGDPLLAWLYQPAVRSLRARLYGDDLSFLQEGLPAVFASDSSFSAFYPWYHQPTDTADKLDAGALARMGRSVLGALDAVLKVPRGPTRQPEWFSAFGRVVAAPWLLALGALSLVPRILRSRGGLAVPAQAALFGLLLWRHPVAALWVFLLPNLLAGVGGAVLSIVSLLPLVSLAALGALAWLRGFVSGLWLSPWELLAAAGALVLLWVRTGAGLRAGRRLPGIRAIGRASARSRSRGPA